jgi:hypothetical protein
MILKRKIRGVSVAGVAVLGIIAVAGLRDLSRFNLLSSGLSSTEMASQRPVSDGALQGLSQESKIARFEAYTYQEQPMETVNWLYIGFAPRMNDPRRVRVILSKSGLTARVVMTLNDRELADYPGFLVRRARGIESQIAAVNRRGSVRLQIPQSRRFQQYLQQISDIERAGYQTADQGYELLSRFFPANVRRFRNDQGEWRTEAHFVYPITIHREALSMPISQAIPSAKVYNPFAVEERRSAHYDYDDQDGDGRVSRTQIRDHLFGGFPAFWLDPGGKSVGLHGPIRFSSVDEPAGLSQVRFIRDPLLLEQIQPRIRFDVVRTANSAGCFRAEPMEIRHLLPSRQELVRQVAFEVIDDFDRIGQRIVDVDYYVENHYREQSRSRWYRRHLLTFEEKQRAKVEPEAVAEVLNQRIRSLMVFPYLAPNVIEFRFERMDGVGRWNAEAASEIMSVFNRLPFPQALTSSARP